MKGIRKIVEIDEERCTGCGQCVPACAEGAMQIVDGKARLVKDIYCDGLGACLGECPEGALRIIEREAEEFDPEAVEEYLRENGAGEHAPHEPGDSAQSARHGQPAHSGCPSSRVVSLGSSPCDDADRPRSASGGASALRNWPVKIKLIPANAPFLKGADVLVAADCTVVVRAGFHNDFLQGKALLTGCPKFDNPQEYVKKFAEIFHAADIRSVTVLDMEVPCCSALPMIVKKGMAMAGKDVPVEEITISINGKVIKREKSAA